MILFDVIKSIIDEFDIPNRSLWYHIKDLKLEHEKLPVYHHLPTYMYNFLRNHNFESVYSLHSSSLQYILLSELKEYICFFSIDRKFDPVAFESIDILSNDLDYNVLKYGKILLEEIS